MRNEQAQSIGLIILLIFGFFVAGIFVLSRSLGADFEVTLQAVVSTAVLVFVAALAVWHFELPIVPALGVVLSITWVLWWGVLASMAHGGIPDEMIPYQFEPPWWNSGLFRWVVEALLVGGTGYAFFRRD